MSPARPIRLSGLLLPLLVAALVAGCGGSAVSSIAPSGDPSAAPSAVTGGTPGLVTSALGAVEAIRERTPLFDGFHIHNPDLIGQASFFTAEPADGGWRVTFETGWGDCPAGCIDRHTWTWDVAEDGTVTFVGEDGSPLAPEQLVALQASAQNRTGVAGRATGGPTCPVEQPGDPACAGRMVSGATLLVRGADGSEVASFTTDGSGLFRIALPPGDYTLEADPVEGYMSAPGPVPFTVTNGAETWLDIPYDTGIR
jgi:hypothetical protein